MVGNVHRYWSYCNSQPQRQCTRWLCFTWPCHSSIDPHSLLCHLFYVFFSASIIATVTGLMCLCEMGVLVSAPTHATLWPPGVTVLSASTNTVSSHSNRTAHTATPKSNILYHETKKKVPQLSAAVLGPGCIRVLWYQYWVSSLILTMTPLLRTHPTIDSVNALKTNLLGCERKNSANVIADRCIHHTTSNNYCNLSQLF